MNALLCTACAAAGPRAPSDDEIARPRSVLASAILTGLGDAVASVRLERRGHPSWCPIERSYAPLGESPVRGARDALVTIVEWGDYQCPYTRRAQDVVEQLLEDYPDELRIVFKHNPLAVHGHAREAASAAAAARRQNAFWKRHEHLLSGTHTLSAKALAQVAAELGLDVALFLRDMRGPEVATEIAQDQEDAFALGARGTPAFFVNGRFLAAGGTVEHFRAVIEEELVRSRRLVASGVATDAVYDTISRVKLSCDAVPIEAAAGRTR